MSYLHIGKNVMVSRRRIIGVFGLDITSQSPRTREFLERAEKDGVVLDACDDIPKSFLVCDHPYHKQLVYISQLNTQTSVSDLWIISSALSKPFIIHSSNSVCTVFVGSMRSSTVYTPYV